MQYIMGHMTLKIPEEILEAAKLDEREVLVELACHLFDIDRLSLGQAARLAGVNRTQFEDELHKRQIAIYRYTEEELGQDMASLAKMRQ
jgi:predicted HTH domain antitoxin